MFGVAREPARVKKILGSATAGEPRLAPHTGSMANLRKRSTPIGNTSSL